MDDRLLINVPEFECLPIINRTMAAKTAKQLQPWLKLLEDMVNYGSALIPRLYGDSGKTLGDSIVLAVLLRQIIAMFDAIEILMSQGAVHAASLQLRAMMEAWIYLEWMLAGDKEKKARHYYVANLRRQRLWALRVQPDSQEGKDFRAIMEQQDLPVNETLGAEGKAKVLAIEEALARPESAAVQAEFQAWKKQHGRNASWYSPLGVANLREMAMQIGKEPIYAMVYGRTSDVIHSGNYEDHIHITEGKITVQGVRHPGKFREVFQFSTTIAMNTFWTVLGAYRPHELPVLGRKYMEKWRAVFMNPPNIEIKTEDAVL